MNIRNSKSVTTTFGLVLLASLMSQGASAQQVERIYASNSCNTLDYGDTNSTGTWTYNNDQSLDAGAAGTDGLYRIVCPIVRQKVGSANGAKFFVYVDDVTSDADIVECTMTSRRPRNGALVSSATRTRTGAQANSSSEIELARSVSPSSTFGHYSLECSADDNDPRFHGYRIREF